ncbi:MAG: cytochrome c3 family protein [Deltaproteobacteria bacterium]|nr:cytochrome c3 family protein [Deltaproteobacteria bacterium]
MSKTRYLVLALLVSCTPLVVYAVGMEGMGGMGGMQMVDEVAIQTKDVGKVVFSHSAHSGMFQCGACHPGLFQKKANSNHATMKAMESGKSCGACHNGKKAFSVTGSCASCHGIGNVVFKEKENGDVTFSHEFHTDVAGCDSCHPKVFKAKRGANKATMEEMEKGKSCGACHDGSNAFSVGGDCDKCHKQ